MTPVLLPAFLAGTLTIVLAVVAVDRIDADWADFLAIALAGGVLALILRSLAWRLDDDGPED